MLNPITLFVLFHCSLISYAQVYNYPEFKKQGTFNEFILPEWKLLDSTEGDLNQDGLADISMIVECKNKVSFADPLNENNVVSIHPRVLLILFKSPKSKNYILAERSNRFIFSNNSTHHDPYNNMVIENGQLTISFYYFGSSSSGWTNDASYCFKFQNNEFELLQAEIKSFNRRTHDSKLVSVDFIKKTIISSKHGDHSSDTGKEASFQILQLKNLKTFLIPNSYEVTENIFI